MGSPNTLENTNCPFCGLLCTDVGVRVDGLRVTADAALPEACRAAYEAAGLDAAPSPQIRGRDAGLDEAVRHAAGLLNKAKHPLFAGLSADANAIRAVLRIAARRNGTVDHLKSVASGATRVTQDFGWVGATLSEAATRADLFVVLGRDTPAVNPRFAERILARRPRNEAPRVLFVGSFTDDDIPAPAKELQHEIVPIPDEALADAVRYLNVLSLNNPPPAIEALPSEFRDALQKLHKAMSSANYACVVWHAGAFGERHTDIPLTSLSRLIKRLNHKTRCVSLPLGNNDADSIAQSVALWHTGKPACVSFSTADKEHNPTIYNASALLEQQRVDALFWLVTLSPKPPPESEVKTVVLGHPAMKFDRAPEVFIPVGIPGIDHAGHLSRVDGVVALRMARIRESGLPSAADILARIDDAPK